jgi:hypothetical protein
MSHPWPAGAATGIGSLPGTDPAEAVRLVLGEVAELPYLPELPGRGFGADVIARTGALLIDFPLEWQPHGWTVAGGPGRDLARARDHLQRDLDALTEYAQGVPLLKVSVCGPMTLGAALLADLTGRLPGTAFVLQVDEPGLPRVLAGQVPTPSGYGTVRSLPRSVAGPALTGLLEVAAPGHRVVHCCDARVPYDLLAGSGTSAVSVDASLIADAHIDALGELVETGISLWLGVFPGTDAPISTASACDQIRLLWTKLGFESALLAEAVVPTPSCGLAGASMSYARRVMSQLSEVGAALRNGLE